MVEKVPGTYSVLEDKVYEVAMLANGLQNCYSEYKSMALILAKSSLQRLSRDLEIHAI
jgi:hypothetical protein